MNKTHQELVEKLTKLQTERYSSIFHRYNEAALLIVTTKKTRGRNSFQSIITNSNIVNNSSGNERKYLAALTDEFKTNKPISNQQLIQRVCAQRTEFNYPQITNNILDQCLDELAKVYFFEQGTYNHENTIVIGVKPLVRLMVD